MNGTNGSTTSRDPRTEELLAAVHTLQTQNAEKTRINEGQLLHSQTLEARERQLHEQLTNMCRTAQIAEATRTPLGVCQPFLETIQVVEVHHRFRDPVFGVYNGPDDP